MNEEEIISLIRQRNQEGAKELLHSYGSLIRYVVSPILTDAQDREDCVSEITLRVWERIDCYNSDKGSFKGWITAVSRNAALNFIRQNKFSDSVEEIEEHMPSNEPTPEETVIMNERRETLLSALKQLSSMDAELFYRKYYYLQSTEQIASELSMTVRAVEGRLYRIKKRLRKRLGGEENE